MNNENETPDNLKRRSGDSVHIKNSFGEADVSGNNVIAILIVIAAIVLGGYFTNAYLEALKNLRDGLEEIKFVLTLSDDERKGLKLAMPASLRKQLMYKETFNR